MQVGVFPPGMHKVSTSKPTGNTHPALRYVMQREYKEGSVSNSGFLAPTTAIIVGAATELVEENNMAKEFCRD